MQIHLADTIADSPLICLQIPLQIHPTDSPRRFTPHLLADTKADSPCNACNLGSFVLSTVTLSVSLYIYIVRAPPRTYFFRRYPCKYQEISGGILASAVFGPRLFRKMRFLMRYFFFLGRLTCLPSKTLWFLLQSQQHDQTPSWNHPFSIHSSPNQQFPDPDLQGPDILDMAL